MCVCVCGQRFTLAKYKVILFYFLKNAKNASSLPKLISFHDWVIDAKSCIAGESSQVRDGTVWLADRKDHWLTHEGEKVLVKRPRMMQN